MPQSGEPNPVQTLANTAASTATRGPSDYDERHPRFDLHSSDLIDRSVAHLVRRLARDRAQAPTLRLITNHDKDPALSVAARGSPDGGVKNLCDQFAGNRIRLQPAQCAGSVHGVEKTDVRHVSDVLEATTLGSNILSFAGFVGDRNRNPRGGSPRRPSLHQ